MLSRRLLFVSPSGVGAFCRTAISELGLASLRTLLITTSSLASLGAFLITALRFPMFQPSSRRLPAWLVACGVICCVRDIVDDAVARLFLDGVTDGSALAGLRNALDAFVPASRSRLASGALLLLSASRILMRKSRSMSPRRRLNLLPN
jgi:hypothetical protein